MLTISGAGFDAQSFSLFINDKPITKGITVSSNTSITVKGNKKKLGLIKGNNTVKVVISGVSSNVAGFTF